MFNKAVPRCFFVFGYIFNWYRTQDTCDRVVFEDLCL